MQKCPGEHPLTCEHCPGEGVGFGVGLGVGVGVGLGLGAGVGLGVGTGVGLGVGAGVASMHPVKVGNDTWPLGQLMHSSIVPVVFAYLPASHAVQVDVCVPLM